MTDDTPRDPPAPRDRGPLWRASVREEVDDELAFHVEMRVRQLVAQGMSAEAARADAIRRFGDIDRVNRTCREIGRRRERHMRIVELFGEARHDVAYAVRQLRRSPVFTLTASLTLALGIGATTAIYSAVHAVILRPIPYVDADRVMVLYDVWRDEPADMSAGNFDEYRRRSTAFVAMSAIQYSNFNLSDGDRADRVMGARVTAGFFDVLPARPILGRLFRADEDVPGAEPVVILSHRLWANRFGSDSSVLGRRLRLSGQQYTVVGVMPRDFDLTSTSEELWVPAAFTAERLAMHDEHFLTVLALLKPEATHQRAQEELEAIARDMSVRFPDTNGQTGVRAEPFTEDLIGDYRARLLILLGAVGLVLLIACANVANLLLARGASRARELAIRSALGAGGARIARQLLTESLVLAAVAALGGVALAYWGIDIIVAMAPAGIPRLDQAALDGPVLAFAAASAVASTLIFGLAPAIRAARSDLQSVLKEGGRTTLLASRDRLRSGLVVAEVGLALTLLVGAGLLIRSAINLQQVDLGFDARGVITGRLALPRAQYASAEASRGAYTRIIETLAASPGVESAAATSQAPMGPGGNSNGLVPEGRPFELGSVIDTRLRIVTPGYFGTMRIPVRSGRGFTDRDTRNAELVMVINETLARLAFPGEDPIGKRISCCEGAPGDPRWKVVVGVAADVHWRGPGNEPGAEFYLPMAQIPDAAWDWIERGFTVVARGAGEPARLAGALREATRSVDPGLPVYDIATMTERFHRSVAQVRFNTLLLTALGVTGLFLATIGLYGVLAYLVAQRTHEIGVRIALGATPRDVMLLVTAQGMRLIAIGIAVGVVGALLGSRLLGDMLEGVAPTDPLTFAGVVAVLIVAGIAASMIPARRATRVDPTRALGSMG